MNMEKLNHWLTLTANIGVLIGIVFLASEINQSNRIGTNSAELALLGSSSELATLRIENSELFSKLVQDSELSGEERVKAEAISVKFVMQWASLESTYRNELLEEYVYDISLLAISNAFRDYPGLRPYFAMQRDNANYTAGQSRTIDVQLSELANYGY